MKENENSKKTPAWAMDLMLTRDGDVVNNLSNLALIVEKDTAISDVLRYDETDGKFYIVQKPAWVPDALWHGRRMAESWDYSQIACYIERHYGMRITSLTTTERLTRDAVMLNPNGRTNKILSAIDGVSWDGRPRAETYFIDTMAIKDTPLNRSCTIKFLKAAMLRQKHPGMKFDSVPIFISAQGVGKSSALRALAMYPTAFKDDVKNFESRDEVAKFASSWVVELAEGAATKAADVDRLKAFITTTSDAYRAPYAREVTEHPRRFVMAITTNNRSPFLRDKTGNRRFWVMVAPQGAKAKISAAELCPSEFGADSVNEYILQVWAEVEWMLMCDGGFERQRKSLLLTDEEREEMNKLVATYTVQSEEENDLRTFISEYTEDRICAQILWEALGYTGRPSLKTDKAAYYAVENVMSTMPGWHCVNKRATIHYTDKFGRKRTVKPSFYYERDVDEPRHEEQLSIDWSTDDPIETADPDLKEVLQF